MHMIGQHDPSVDLERPRRPRLCDGLPQNGNLAHQ
jgi:hypothetical protein